jgi:hypothetical protein
MYVDMGADMKLTVLHMCSGLILLLTLIPWLWRIQLILNMVIYAFCFSVFHMELHTGVLFMVVEAYF